MKALSKDEQAALLALAKLMKVELTSTRSVQRRLQEFGRFVLDRIPPECDNQDWQIALLALHGGGDQEGLLRLAARCGPSNYRYQRYHIPWQAFWLAGEARAAEEVFATRCVFDYFRRWDYLEGFLQAAALVEYPLPQEPLAQLGDRFFKMEGYLFASKLYMAARDKGRLQKLAKRMTRIPAFRLHALEVLRVCESIP